MGVFKDNKTNRWTVKIHFKDWTGKNKQKKKEGFATKKEALEWERDFLNSCRTDITITFENLVIEYMRDCETRLKPTTYQSKEYIISTKILPYFAKLAIGDIDVHTVRKWQNSLLTNSKKFAPTYLKTTHNQLSAILNFAVKYYNLPFNPAARCGSIGKKNADAMQIWTIDEFRQFIVAVSNKPLSELLFNLLFYSGMRSGELLALTLNDFDFESNTININKTFSVLIGGVQHTSTPKTHKSKRIITMPMQIMDLVKQYAEKLYGYKPKDRLFPVTKSYLTAEMIRGCKNSQVKKIRVHDLRHSHASLLIELDFNPLIVSERLGHEDIQTTLNTYSHLYPNKHQEVASKLSTLF